MIINSVSAGRPVLRTVALALLLSFAIGVGTRLRRELERAPAYTG